MAFQNETGNQYRASSVSDNLKDAAADVGKASSKIKDAAIAGTIDTADEAIARLARDISRNPITSVLIAAGIGYFTAVLRRPSRR